MGTLFKLTLSRHSEALQVLGKFCYIAFDHLVTNFTAGWWAISEESRAQCFHGRMYFEGFLATLGTQIGSTSGTIDQWPR